jgi:hypothetical protein
MTCYKLEGRGFDSGKGHLFSFSIYPILPAALGLGAYSAYNRNEYEKQKKMFLERKARPIREADNLTAICEPTA